jgi:hypothetical protein
VGFLLSENCTGREVYPEGLSVSEAIEGSPAFGTRETHLTQVGFLLNEKYTGREVYPEGLSVSEAIDSRSSQDLSLVRVITMQGALWIERRADD